MKNLWRNVLSALAGTLIATVAWAADEKPQPRPANADVSPLTKLQDLVKDKKGELKKADVKDEKLVKLFENADKNKDGVLTGEELRGYVAQQQALVGGGDRGREGDRPREGGDRPREGDRGRGPGGPGGPGGFGGGRPGMVLPPFLQEALKLTEAQKKELEALQKDLDGKLDKLLTEDQRKQLKEMRERGPGGFPGRGGEGGGRPGGEGGRGGRPGGEGGRPGGEGGQRPPRENDR